MGGLKPLLPPLGDPTGEDDINDQLKVATPVILWVVGGWWLEVGYWELEASRDTTHQGLGGKITVELTGSFITSTASMGLASVARPRSRTGQLPVVHQVVEGSETPDGMEQHFSLLLQRRILLSQRDLDLDLDRYIIGTGPKDVSAPLDCSPGVAFSLPR